MGAVFSHFAGGQGLAGAAGHMRLSELLGALSHALDLTEGQPQGHCKRSCWIGVHIGMRLGLDNAALSDLFFTLLLKDLGCSSNAARICALYLADDLAFKRDFKTIDGSLGSALRFVFSKTGLQSGLAERIRAIVTILQNGGEISRDLIETRCQRGAYIAARLRFNAQVQAGIRSLDEHWDGQGKPDGLSGEAIPLNARIALTAQIADIFHREQGRAAAIAEIKARRGTWFDPGVADAFVAICGDDRLWAPLKSSLLDTNLFAMAPAMQSVVVDEDYLDDIASAFADVVDAKSPFTAGHSKRVTLYADMIAETLGLDASHRRFIRRAALLHDIGKLGVSNQILDKPGKLDEAEWQSVKSHPLHSLQILERVQGFAALAPVAGAHHERLDGKGYPFGISGDAISLEARILTVADVFDALSAERPYRKAMVMADALAIMDKDVGTAFDPDCMHALRAALARLEPAKAA